MLDAVALTSDGHPEPSHGRDFPGSPEGGKPVVTASPYCAAQASLGRAYGSPAFTRSFIRASGSTGLTRWRSNPASLDRGRSSSCPQPGQGHQHHARCPTAARGSGEQLRSRSARAGRCRAGPPRAGASPPPRPPPGRRGPCCDLVAVEPQQHRQAVGRVPVVVHDQDAARRGGIGSAAGRLVRRRLAAARARTRQADDELAALAGPVAAGLDRAAVHLHQASSPASARSPARPATAPATCRPG